MQSAFGDGEGMPYDDVVSETMVYGFFGTVIGGRVLTSLRSSGRHAFFGGAGVAEGVPLPQRRAKSLVLLGQALHTPAATAPSS